MDGTLGGYFRHGLMASSAIVCVATATPAVAQTRAFNVPEQDAASGVATFARQADVQLLISARDASGKRTKAVRGNLTVEDGLRQLLANTGLRAQPTGPQTYSVVPSVVGNVGGRSQSGVEPGAAGIASSSGEDEGSAGEEILVVGSRLRQDPRDRPASVTVFDRDRIEELGATSVSGVLDYAPQQPFAANVGSSTTGSREVRLRGLSTGTTLVLVNGRRTITSALTAGSNAFDLNAIPLAAVERIEVLSESASAVYGADALAGVVNIVLRDRVAAPTVDLYYGGSDQGGAEEKRASFTAGFGGSRFSAVLIGDIFRQDGLLGRERNRTANADYTRFGGDDLRTTVTNPGNICTTDGSNLPGLTAPCAAVPQGSTGVGLVPADFAGTAGQSNLASPFIGNSLIPESTRISAALLLDWDLSPNFSAFAEFMHARSDIIYHFGPPAIQSAFTGITVSDDQAFNPFDVPLNISYAVAGLDRREKSKSDASRIVVGLRGHQPIGLDRELDWEVSALWIRDKATAIDRVLDFTSVAAALSAPSPGAALNVFADGPGGSPQFLNGLMTETNAADNKAKALQFSAFASTSLFELPAGPVTALVGGETRREDLAFFLPTETITPSRKSVSWFGELAIPLFGKAGDAHGPGLKLRLAGRYDHYNDFGDAFSPQARLDWRLSPNLLVTASYGESFRAPSLVQLHRPALSFPFPFFDPARNNEFVFGTLSFGGNQDLDPEEGRSMSLGIVYAPGWSDLRLSLNAWKLKQSETIRQIDPFTLLANESLFPNNVTRAAPTPADIAAGLPGVLLGVDASFLNFGRVEVSGIDTGASVSFDTSFGKFTPSIAATWIGKYKAAEVPGQPAVDRVGRASLDGSIPELRATASLGWALDAFSVVGTARFLSDYEDFDIFTGALTGRQVSQPITVDVQAGIDMKKLIRLSAADGLTARLGVVNLFNKEPDFSRAGISGYDATQGDLRQRFIYFSLTKRFQ